MPEPSASWGGGAPAPAADRREARALMRAFSGSTDDDAPPESGPGGGSGAPEPAAAPAGAGGGPRAEPADAAPPAELGGGGSLQATWATAGEAHAAARFLRQPALESHRSAGRADGVDPRWRARLELVGASVALDAWLDRWAALLRAVRVAQTTGGLHGHLLVWYNMADETPLIARVRNSMSANGRSAEAVVAKIMATRGTFAFVISTARGASCSGAPEPAASSKGAAPRGRG